MEELEQLIDNIENEKDLDSTIDRAFEKWIDESEGTKGLLFIVRDSPIEHLVKIALSVAFHSGYEFAQSKTIEILESLKK